MASLGIGFTQDVLPSPPVEVCPAHNENKSRLPTLKTPKRHPRFFFDAAMLPRQPPTHPLPLSIYLSIPPSALSNIHISSERSLLQPHLVPLDNDNRARGIRSDLRNNKRIRQRGVSTADFNFLYICDRKLDSAFRTYKKTRPAATVTENLDLLLSSLAPLASPRRPAGSDTAVCRRRRPWWWLCRTI